MNIDVDMIQNRLVCGLLFKRQKFSKSKATDFIDEIRKTKKRWHIMISLDSIQDELNHDDDDYFEEKYLPEWLQTNIIYYFRE